MKYNLLKISLCSIVGVIAGAFGGLPAIMISEGLVGLTNIHNKAFGWEYDSEIIRVISIDCGVLVCFIFGFAWGWVDLLKDENIAK